MDIIVNSLYSNREVFLRELISNASDALDKARFLSVTDPKVLGSSKDLEIRIKCDTENKTIIIEDTGVGMTREQLLSNLGTIARSGTRRFMEMAKEKGSGENNLIGQFGVGFYSAFLVADKVRVQSRSWEDDKQWLWEAAAGSHKFSISEDTVSPDSPDFVKRGVRISLHLKEDAASFCDPALISRLVKQYSQFISFPIKLYQSDKVPKKVLDEAMTKKKQEEADKRAAEKNEPSKPVDPVMKTVVDEIWDWRVQNDNKPIWTRSPKEVDAKSYEDFYKATFQDFMEPLAHSHFNVEGTVEFSSILYVPSMAPHDDVAGKKTRNIKMYVKRVFISDAFDEDLLPRYLHFVKGVVDSSDLPLNVSREILQESKVVRMIRKQITRRTLDMLDDLAKAEGGEDYVTFWKNFGRHLKFGAIEDSENRNRLAKLLRFHSSVSTGGQAGGEKAGGEKDSVTKDDMTSLEGYVSRMKEGQKAIYYLGADSVEGARASPFVEKLMAKGYEILFLTEPVDESTIAHLEKFNDLPFEDVSKEGITLDEAEAAKQADLEKAFSAVNAFVKETLGKKVEKVVVSSRLSESPCALITSRYGWSANMERIMKTQAVDPRGFEYMKGQKTLELNPEHAVVKGLKDVLEEKDMERAKDLAELLYETSLITSGFQLENPKSYASKVYALMRMAIGDEGAVEKKQQE